MIMNKSRTSLVLMELIITILLFSISSAVCVKLFVESRLLTNSTEELNHAVEKSQEYAETFRGTDGDINSILALYPSANSDGKTYIQFFYDSNFTETINQTNASYSCNIKINNVSSLASMDIIFIRLKDQTEVYKLNATKYIQIK